MRFPKKRLFLVSIRTGTSQKGNPYTFVKLAEKETYDSIDMMLNKENDATKLEIQKDYDVEVDTDGNFTSVVLTPAAADKKP